MTTVTQTSAKPVLVTGGAGKTGRRVAQRLWDQGLPVRVASRSSGTPFDWNDPATWAATLDGAQAAYVCYQPDLAVPGAVETIRDFATLAVDLGVTRLVLLSGRGEAEAQSAEQALIQSGAAWTIVRSSWFMQNFSESFFLDLVLGGEMALPAGEIGEPFVDAEDVADVAAAALTDDRHIGKLYEVTGPRLLTFAQAAREIGEARGRRVGFTEVTPDAFAAMMSAQGAPSEVTDLVLYLFTTVLDGRNAQATDGVEQALGRPAGDFADYARRAAATGVWEVR